MTDCCGTWTIGTVYPRHFDGPLLIGGAGVVSSGAGDFSLPPFSFSDCGPTISLSVARTEYGAHLLTRFCGFFVTVTGFVRRSPLWRRCAECLPRCFRLPAPRCRFGNYLAFCVLRV